MLTPLLTVLGAASLAGVLTLDRGAPSRRLEGLALAAPLALFWAFNLDALGSWWTADDPCLLRSVYEHGLTAHFYDPAVWRPLSGTLLMPWSLFSLGLDSRVFGLEPTGFYAHQLVSFSLLLALTYAFARTFLRAAFSSAATSLFAVSPASFAVAQQLMSRHYLEGLIFSLTALWLFRRSVSASETLWPAMTGSALCYLLATTAKEIYVPLVAVPFLMPVADNRRRLRRAWPWLAVAALYGPWRIYMLGWDHSFSASVYGSRTESFELADLPWPTAVAAALVVLLVWKVPAARGLTVGLVGVVALPLVPVAAELEPRHLLTPVLLCALGVALVLERLDAPGGRRRLVARLVSLVLVGATVAALVRAPLRLRHHDNVEAVRREGQLILQGDDDGVLITRLGLPFYLGCLSDLRRLALDLPPGPGFCPDPCLAGRDRPLWRVDRGQVRRLDADVLACNQSQPLTVSFRHDDTLDTLRWQLGPWTEGSYRASIVFSTDPPRISAPIPLTRAGRLPWTLDRPLSWVVLYRSPDGWVTWSPVLTLEPGGTVEVRRPE